MKKHKSSPPFVRWRRRKKVIIHGNKRNTQTSKHTKPQEISLEEVEKSYGERIRRASAATVTVYQEQLSANKDGSSSPGIASPRGGGPYRRRGSGGVGGSLRRRFSTEQVLSVVVLAIALFLSNARGSYTHGDAPRSYGGLATLAVEGERG